MTKFRNEFILISCLGAALFCTELPTIQAQAAEDQTVAIAEVRIGFQGKYKVGYWTPVWIRLKGGAEPIRGNLDVTVVDGDGLKTRTSVGGQIELPANDDLTVMRCVKPGKVSSGLTVEFRSNDEVLASRTFADGELPRPASSTSGLIVTAGRDVGIDAALQILRRTSEATALIDDFSMLPSEWFAYEAVDTLVLTTSHLAELKKLTTDQVDALYRWVTMGGRLILSIGQHGEEAIGSGQGPLAKFVPGDFERVVNQYETSALESYVAATERLDRVGHGHYRMTELSNARGIVEVFEQARTAQRQPVVIRAPLAFGQVTLVAADLDQPPFSQWRDRTQMVAKLLQPDLGGRRERTQTRRSGKAAHVGYEDLSGQLRAALDQFSGVQTISFFGVAALVFVYLLLIGPADYFLLKQLVGRMEWTWISFPLLVVSFGGLAVLLAAVCRSGELHVNQVEIIDIDAETATTRGTTWAHLYSPETREYDLGFAPQLPDRGEVEDVLLSWQGLPGDGLGGMNMQSAIRLVRHPYSIVATQNRGWQMKLEGMPIQVSSSKTVFVRWTGKSDLTLGSRLTADRINGELRGTLTNPLPITLQHAAVYFGNTAYRLEDALDVGETIDFDVNRPVGKSLDGYLTQKRVIESDDVVTKWETTSRDVPRIMQMMMFHEAAGGQSYTKLTQRYHGDADLSDHLRLGRAVLVGYVNQRTGVLKSGDAPLDKRYDENRQWTFYRIILPVKIEG